MHAMLASPQFLYVSEPPALDGTIRTASPRELLTRWTLALFQSIPTLDDVALLQSHDLNGKAGRAALLETLVDDPRARRGLGEFHVEWMHVSEVADSKDFDLYPSWNAGTRDAAINEVREVSVKTALEGGSFANLMTTREGLINDQLAEIYGVSAPANGVEEWINLGDERTGLLTRSAPMASLAGASEGSVIHRGLFVRSGLLCDEIPEPPAITDPSTDRLTNPGCQSCHRLIDPIGFGFEPYDAIGRYDGSTQLSGATEVTPIAPENPNDGAFGEFGDAAELSTKLSQSDTARGCYTEHAVQYMVRSVSREWMHCAAEHAEETLGGTASIKDIFVEALASDAYRAVGPSREVSAP